MALLPPFFLDCVVAIGVIGPEQKMAWTGTGFFYGIPTNKNEKGEQLYSVYLVSNRHVFVGKSEIWIRVNPQNSEPAKDMRGALVDQNGKNLWTGHPIEKIDVAVMKVNAQVLRDHNLRYSFFEEDHHVYFLNDLKSDALSEGDPIFILGFPLGITGHESGHERKYAICRSGIIARIRDWIDGKSREFLIDASIFPGNSGGPVVCSVYGTSIQNTKSVERSSLIGLVQSYVPYRDVAISEQTKRPRIIFEENSGLALVVPSDYIRETIQHEQKQKSLPIAV